ncbi:MAG TPA: magnesium-translocating P-type ATPase [Polyangiaceae bacterium]|nr:magnesium-translocating P-type ATPase [Polyangiaceae bacterium]
MTGAVWTLSTEEVARRFETRPDVGLASAEVALRRARDGPNEIAAQRRLSAFGVLLDQLRSPLLLLLVFAAGASLLSREWVDASVVVVIVSVTVAIGFSRELGARRAAVALRARVKTHAVAVRDGARTEVPLADLVRGDVIELSAGSIVPADAIIVESTDFFTNEAALTGESFPVEKKAGPCPEEATLREQLGSVFMGTNARSGVARCIVVETGARTQFGGIAQRLTLRPPETEFDRGLRRFGYLLTVAMLVMVFVVFAANAFLGRPLVETLLFSIALAVGLSPELLPAILSVNLARGAQTLAELGVLVKRLNAIEDLGSMDILCTDKTGTLTEGIVELEGAYDVDGARSAEVAALAATNAALQTGLENPLDTAITRGAKPRADLEKVAEIPYDFVRKRLSVVVKGPEGIRLVTKGAFDHVLRACTRWSRGGPFGAAERALCAQRYESWAREGTRVLALATRSLDEAPSYGPDVERDLELVGFLTFLDRPKQGVSVALEDLRALGVSVKLITGDSRLVAEHVAGEVSMPRKRVLTGKDLDELHEEALWVEAERTDLFVEVDPNQKERIILALKRTGHVVGFLGDGINDAPAMHAADTAMSVESAVDVAKEAADFVLLERDLDVIRRGIAEGRKTFANTLKYVNTTTSANLGNMVSMAIASLFLPFLPLTAGQILLNNFLSDIPAVGIADDDVDPELVDRPRRWDMRSIARFMVGFGLLSSFFDFVTFAALIVLFHANVELFRTGWFVESLLTELVVALVIRTRRRFYRSRPGRFLLVSSLVLVGVAFAIPYVPGAGFLGFVPMPLEVAAVVGVIMLAYVAATELLKSTLDRPHRRALRRDHVA